LFVVFFLFALAPLQAFALNVNDVRLGLHEDKIRLVLDLDGKTEFRAFTLDNPSRLTIDLPRYQWNVGTIAKPPSAHVVGIRQGELNANTSRIVMEFSNAVAIRSAFTLPAKDGKPNRLVIDFVRSKGDNNKVFGTLKVDGQGAMNNAPSPAPHVLRAPDQKFSDSAIPSRKPVRGEAFDSKDLDFPPVPSEAPIRGNAKNTMQMVTVSDSHAPASSVPIPMQKPVLASAKAPMENPTPVPQSLPSPSKSSSEKPLVVIDAGHGGVDPGAIGANGIFEKHIALAIAKELKRQLEATGRYRVKMTRDRDIFIKLKDRVAFARANKADLFVSIHADSMEDKDAARGASIYTLSEKASDAQAAKLADRENSADNIAGIDLRAEDQDVAMILIDLTMRDTMNQSSFLANAVVENMQGDGVKTLQRPHQQAGFAVLKAPDVPSVLIETGFVSNRQEADLLSTPSHQKKIAAAIAKGIATYFFKVQKNRA
jgi:N-acetylmuramoyl-L-alanine amidase